MAVTINESDLCHLLPVEVAGFFLGRLSVTKGSWVLLASNDNHSSLGANLSVRGPVPLNVVVGMSHLYSNQVTCALHSFVLKTCIAVN